MLKVGKPLTKNRPKSSLDQPANPPSQPANEETVDQDIFQAYISANPNQNTSLLDSSDVVRYLKALNVRTYGIFANPQVPRAPFISVAELQKHGLSPSTHKLAFVIRLTPVNESDPDAQGEYSNLAMLSSQMKQAVIDGSLLQWTCSRLQELNALNFGQTPIDYLLSVPAIGNAMYHCLADLTVAE